MEGILKLQKDRYGGRHCIAYPNGSTEELEDGDFIEVMLNNRWVTGQYRSDICPDKYAAYLVVIDKGDQVLIKLEAGLKVRLVKACYS